MGWHGGSQGEVRRMRAEPVVPVEVAWERGRNSRHKLAEKLAALYQPRLGQSSRLAYERAAAHYCTNGEPGCAPLAMPVNTEAVLL